jgi:hypothetical protein
MHHVSQGLESFWRASIRGKYPARKQGIAACWGYLGHLGIFVSYENILISDVIGKLWGRQKEVGLT